MVLPPVSHFRSQIYFISKDGHVIVPGLRKGRQEGTLKNGYHMICSLDLRTVEIIMKCKINVGRYLVMFAVVAVRLLSVWFRCCPVCSRTLA